MLERFFSKRKYVCSICFFLNFKYTAIGKKLKITLKEKEMNNLALPFQILLPAKAFLSFLCILLYLNMSFFQYLFNSMIVIKALLTFNFEKDIIPILKELTTKRKKKCVNDKATSRWLKYSKV